MRVSDLNPHPHNPRKITDAKLQQLGKTIKEFGSLDGIVFNKVRQELVSGHQRLKHAKPDTEIVITETLDKIDEHGTTARGYVEIEGDKFPYREVAWDEDVHSAAMLAVNMNAGEWDLQRRADIMLNLDKKNKDLELTGHDEKQIKDLVAPLWGDEITSGVEYTKKVESPVYEIKGERPPVADLLDDSRTKALIQDIQSSAVPGEVKEFLVSAAQRHTIFNYENIAEYYAHAPKEVQTLMEDSALIIIDFNKAIELGFAHLTECLAAQAGDE